MQYSVLEKKKGRRLGGDPEGVTKLVGHHSYARTTGAGLAQVRLCGELGLLDLSGQGQGLNQGLLQCTGSGGRCGRDSSWIHVCSVPGEQGSPLAP